MVALTLLSLAAAVAIIPGAFAVPAPDPNMPDFEIGPHTGNLARRQLDYNQNWKAGQGNINYQSTSNGYSVTFSGAGDFVVGKGWRTGKARNITFSGSTQQTAGTVLMSVYGWTKNPLIEYYVQEYTSNGAGSAQGQKVGSLTSDGSTYDIWKHQQVNQPSISGTATFWQFISNRQNKRPGSGTVTLANHFDAWKKAGMNLGSQHDYQVVATEGWGNAGGNSKYTVSEGGGGDNGGGQQQPPQQPSSVKPPTQPATTARPPSTSIATKTETKTETKSVTATATVTATKTETKTQATTEVKSAATVTVEVTHTAQAATVTKTEVTTKTEVSTMLVASICAMMTNPPAPAAPSAMP